ncbi:MAG: divergent polysaccharide deacetylase family protein, partial [Candidatus Ratteibacteria bacterium]|nr:divergent polysaccharide deacetylase family protein [Candidatus Ratteibacteria bacterium]
MSNKRLSDNSPFLLLVLFIILCILITGIGIIKEIRKRKVPVIPVPRIEEERPPAPKKEVPLAKKAQIGIIIDDLGWSKEIVKEIERLNRPITIAILPYAPYSKDIFQEVRNRQGIDVLLHLPLEPKPPAQSLDKGVIKTDMGEDEIKRQFYDALKDFYPGVKGVNNHEGSLFTSDEEKMQILLEAIQSKNLFFVDSMTARQSKGYLLAKEMGIKTAKRDIFLDNRPDPQYIEGQVRQLIETAKRQGRAIGIGHARKNTIAVLRDMLPEIEKEGVELVPV